MSDQSVRPEECPPGKHYTGIVRTGSGTHARILQRSSGYWELPWFYYKEEFSTPLFAADDDVSELQELDPLVHHHLNEIKSEKRRLQLELQGVRHELEQATLQLHHQAEVQQEGALPLTESRVRELAREEINKTSWQEPEGEKPELDHNKTVRRAQEVAWEKYKGPVLPSDRNHGLFFWRPGP